ncbi:MAG: EFR1 family ferrodoxin [Firmicutes bacterium]|nr:EFR1 family ferrodoxin [Bacillota bacterium]
MKTCIYTFSGTGTALSISDQVSTVVGDATVERIPRLLAKSTAGEIKVGAPKIGFVFPNYFGGIPNIVRTFIRQLNLDGVAYIFAIVPAGGGQGYSLKFLQKELRQKGKKLHYGRYAAAIGNYIVAGSYESLGSKSGERREKALALMREKIHRYAEEIKAEKESIQRSSLMFFTINRLLSRKEVRKGIVKDTSGWDKEYSIGGKCTGCGICAKVCQASNIVMRDNTPSFQHQCYRCMACIQYCPQNAILFGGKELDKPKYVHPDFPAEAMIKRIREQEERG